MLEIYQHRHGVREAHERGETCGRCFRPFKDCEPAWLAAVETFQSTYLPPVCQTCRPARETYAPPRPCIACHRPVYEPIGNRRATVATCSARCRALFNQAHTKAVSQADPQHLPKRLQDDALQLRHRDHHGPRELRARSVNGGAKLVHPGGAKLVHLTLCGTRCWGVVPVVHRRDPRCFE